MKDSCQLPAAPWVMSTLGLSIRPTASASKPLILLWERFELWMRAWPGAGMVAGVAQAARVRAGAEPVGVEALQARLTWSQGSVLSQSGLVPV